MKRSFKDKVRGIVKRQRKPVMFLSLEGKNKTEKLYFSALNKDQGGCFSLQFTSGIATDVNGMLESLDNFIKDSFSEKDGDMAFCVCDVDFETYKVERIRELKRALLEDRIKLIVSNPCFEIWYLNHFRYSTKAYGSSEKIKSALSAYIEGYEKSGDYYESHLKNRTRSALENSVRQYGHHIGQNTVFEAVVSNPGTDVSEIVRLLLSNL